MPIPFHRPYFDDREAAAAAAAVASGQVGGHGPHLRRSEALLARRLGDPRVLVTTSATHALEIAMQALGIGPGDEVIVPAYAFATTAGCVVQRGAEVVFADVLPEDPQLDVADVAARITPRTKAVVAIHYAGIPCAIDALAALARDRGLFLVEDAAHALDSRWRGVPCGRFGIASCFSFHATKNVSCGEGGAFVTADDALARTAEIIRDMGTDRGSLLRGEVDRYTWRGAGSSFVPSDILMAVLEVQLGKADEILALRRRLFWRYHDALADLEQAELLVRPRIPDGAEVNGHIYHVVLPDAPACEFVQRRLAEAGITASRHYECLDLSPFGRRFVRPGSRPCRNSHELTGRLLRLPLFAGMTDAMQDHVVASLRACAAPAR